MTVSSKNSPLLCLGCLGCTWEKPELKGSVQAKLVRMIEERRVSKGGCLGPDSECLSV